MCSCLPPLTGRKSYEFETKDFYINAFFIAGKVSRIKQDSTPMNLLIGQIEREFAGREVFQEIDYRFMLASLTKWVAEIDRASRVPVGRGDSGAIWEVSRPTLWLSILKGRTEATLNCIGRRTFAERPKRRDKVQRS
jgi:hypothetical protein